MTTRPPLGLTPRFIVDEKRLKEVDAAMLRYAIAQMEIPNEWHLERSELVLRLNEYYNRPIGQVTSVTQNSCGLRVDCVLNTEQINNLVERGLIAGPDVWKFANPDLGVQIRDTVLKRAEKNSRLARSTPHPFETDNPADPPEGRDVCSYCGCVRDSAIHEEKSNG